MKFEFDWSMMEEKIIQLFFPKFYGRYLIYKELKRPINVNPIRNYEKVFNAIKKDEVDVLGIEMNRADEYVIVTKRYIDNVLYIMLYGPSYINNHPRIMAEVCTLKTEKFIKISDINMIDNEIGNGSICMEYFLKEARNTSVNHIDGYLSLGDIDHFDRLEHFYLKYGFLVKFSPNRSSGDLKLSFIDKI
ncbi:hypothetical protein [Lacrimispora sp.]|uniref:hypothetical protein n=1 Tax=Lacrimispora sp. TaxID=2719234 RepID=UPI0028A801BA|nr:hypothetical protein [Lacrimispora sp.]